MTNCCDEISDPTPIHVASRIAQDHDPIEAGSFVKSDWIEKSSSGEKLLIRSLYHRDRIVSGIGPWYHVGWIHFRTSFQNNKVHDSRNAALSIGFYCYVSTMVLEWTSYQIRNIVGCCTCTGNAGSVYPPSQLPIPTYITARAWCTCRDACRNHYLAVSLEVGGGENVPSMPGARATRNAVYLVRTP